MIPSRYKLLHAVFAACSVLNPLLSQAEVKIRALVVGIQNYPQPPKGPKIGALSGCLNDVDLAVQMLQTRLNCREGDIKTLRDQEATHEAIVTRIYEHLVLGADENTIVVFWFSGHGSRIPDRSGKDAAEREEGRKALDSTLLAWDSRTTDPYGSYDLADDELASLFAECKARQVILVMDCCHAGGLTRGEQDRRGVRDVEVGTKPLDVARVKKFWPKDKAVELRDDDAKIAEHKAKVLIAASGATEEAGEDPLENGKTYGTLTWHLVRALTDAQPSATWDEVVQAARLRALGRGTKKTQTIHWQGAGELVAFGNGLRQPPPGFTVLPDDRTNPRVTVEAGRVHGIGAGASFRLVDYEGNEVDQLTATDVRMTFTTTMRASKLPLPNIALRAIPVDFGQDAPLLRVFNEAGVEGLDTLKFVSVVQPPSGRARGKAGGEPPQSGQAGFTQESRKPPEPKLEPEYVLERRQGGLRLRVVGDDYARELSDDPTKLRHELLREHYWLSLWNSGLQAGKPLLTASFVGGAGKRLSGATGGPGLMRYMIGVGAFENPDSAKGGTQVELVIQNQGTKPMHVNVLSVGENRETHWLGRDRRNALLEPKKEMRIPLVVGRIPEWERAMKRPLLDRYIVIGTERKADFLAFENWPVPGELTRGEPVPLPPLLQEAMAGSRTRGGNAGGGGWTVTTCDLTLLSEQQYDGLFPRGKEVKR